ncbi:MAG TPA: peptide ABC transporter substrate-binding protein, partial [Gammaproteobacteria bacterium]|nr:peptide ABC transporter substrate-binding protein [Gammaproteobacteria bacterium]
RSYSSNEYAFIGQIYEPPLQYHYLKRPYELIPLTAKKVPVASLYDKQGNQLPADSPAEQVDHSIYTIEIKPGIQFQPHPAFARDEAGAFLYHALSEAQLEDIYRLDDFPVSSYRELTASDYVYQMKRMAKPSLHSPILGTMAEYIVGLRALYEQLKKVERENKKSGGKTFINLNEYKLPGVTVVDRYTYQIRVKGVYPQLVYWLSMPFFAPMAEEVDAFYAQTGLKEKNINLDWYPVGTGAYMLTVNNPNRVMVLEKNPNYRDVFYPEVGEVGDEEKGLLRDAGKKIPFIDKVIYNLDKETIPKWNKFLQGYYDTSGINSESFDQAVQFTSSGEAELTPEMAEKGIRLSTSVATSIYYMGFNMRDPVVGGLSEKSKKLRQAISIAVDYEEFISIFANGRGIPAQGIIPPGIFGYQDGAAGINPFVYDWENNRPVRKPIRYAKKLLAEAGYPNGISEKTGKPLTLYLDTTGSGPGDKALLSWYVKQFKKIGIQLVIRSTMYNRFQEKMHKGTAQIFNMGWNADYPDPENFFFLLYGPNSKVEASGENAANYKNPMFDKLFNQMKSMPNGLERQRVIDKMLAILREDAPWNFGYHPKGYSLYHEWYLNAKPNLMSHNTMQYKRIDTQIRAKKREMWNKPVVWPVILLFFILVLATIPAYFTYRRREHMAMKRSEA